MLPLRAQGPCWFPALQATGSPFFRSSPSGRSAFNEPVCPACPLALMPCDVSEYVSDTQHSTSRLSGRRLPRKPLPAMIYSIPCGSAEGHANIAKRLLGPPSPVLPLTPRALGR